MKYEKKYQNIISTCNSILNKKKSIYFISNSLLSIQRPNSNFDSKFDYLLQSNYFLLFNKLLINLFKFLIIFLKSFFIKKVKFNIKNQVLFYSNCNLKKKDMYFLKIKKELEKNNKKYFSLFLNVDIKNDMKINNEIHIQTVPDIITLICITKYILSSIFIFFFEFLKTNNSLEKKILLGAIVNSVSWNTIYNLKLFITLKNLKIKKCCFFYPFEGYAHEKIINFCFKNSSNLTIGYQHAVLYENTNLFGRLNHRYFPHVILSSSNYYSKKLKKNLASKVKIIKLGKKNSKIVKKKASNRILAIPEGDVYEVNYFINFLKEYLNYYPSAKFTLRIHPVFKFNRKKLNDNFKSYGERLKISKKPFSEDISNHNITIYSGSSAIIDCVRHNHVPVYLNIRSKYVNNPLYEINNKIFEVKSKEDLNTFITSKYLKYKRNCLFVKRYANQLFEDVKKPQLNNLIIYLKKYL